MPCRDKQKAKTGGRAKRWVGGERNFLKKRCGHTSDAQLLKKLVQKQVTQVKKSTAISENIHGSRAQSGSTHSALLNIATENVTFG